MFELTGDYRIILPLMLAIALAAGISSLITGDTIYTLKLRRRGVDVMRGRPANVMEIITVGQAMRQVPEGVPSHLSIGELAGRFVGEGREALPVVDENGSYRGVLTAQEIEGSMRENALDATAGSLAHHLPALRPDETLEVALSMLMRQEISGLPVVTRDGNHVVGWLTHRDVLSAYASRLGQEVATAEGTSAAAQRPEGCPGRPSHCRSPCVAKVARFAPARRR
jgi:CIC family chloride channel protein